MARKTRQTGVPQRAASPTTPSTALGKARWMLESGDVRRARAYAKEAATSGPESEREQARALLDELGPDRTAVLVVGVVLLLILFAAWAAILRLR